jgi:hypothetical protein
VWVTEFAAVDAAAAALAVPPAWPGSWSSQRKTGAASGGQWGKPCRLPAGMLRPLKIGEVRISSAPLRRAFGWALARLFRQD